jgi:hypothetical protein
MASFRLVGRRAPALVKPKLWGTTDLPRIRAWLCSLVCGPQARLPAHPGTLPGNDIAGTGGDGICWIEESGEKGPIPVTLQRPDGTRAGVKPLGERLGGTRPATVAKLRPSGTARGDLMQGGASLGNGASHMVNEHPWGTTPHAFARAFLPCAA